MNEAITSIKLKYLEDVENISVRAYNICKYNDLSTLEEIIQFYNKNGNFLKLRNCGAKTNKELIDICSRFKYFLYHAANNFESITQKDKSANSNKEFISLRKMVLDGLFSIKYHELSTRSINALKSFLGEELSLSKLDAHIFSNPNFNLNGIKNLGMKSRKEIDNFLFQISEIINRVLLLEKKGSLINELLNIELIRRFSVKKTSLNKIRDSYDFAQGIPIFKTIKILIEDAYLLKPNEQIIFDYYFNFSSKYLNGTLSELADLIGITREGARVQRNTLYKKLNDKLSFINTFQKEHLNLYNLNTSSLIIMIDQAYIEKLSKNESVDYNCFFVIKVLSVIFKHKFTLIGNEEVAVLKQYNKHAYHWKSTYLVSKQISLIFDFDELINHTYHRLSKKISKDYSLNFKAYLSKFMKSESHDFLDEIVLIAKQLLDKEFGFAIDVQSRITFMRNRSKTIRDHVFSVLEKANKPLNLREILNVLNLKYPVKVKSIDVIRYHCSKDKRLMFFGRSSTYGLKKWEKERENIKGGTMHDISEEFLSKFDEPKPINEITDYVSKFRDNVSPENLIRNLQSAQHRRFVFFTEGYVGLVSKIYSFDHDMLNFMNSEPIQ